MKRITIYDVANEANVSLATVSRVINNSSVVREDTKQRVEEVIKRLGYKPNAIAQGLALQKTTTIALVISDNSVYNTAHTIHGLTDVAKIYKYNIALHMISEGLNSTNETVEAIIKSRADGVLIFDDRFTKEELQELKDFGLPVVILGTAEKYEDEGIGSVYVNFEKMGYEITKKYLAEGKKDVVLVEDRKNRLVMKNIVEGMKKAYKEQNLDFNGYIQIPDEYRTSYVYLKEYFKNKKHDAVITYRDSQAIAVLNSLTELGIKIPDQTEIVCLLDTKYNAMARPQISGYRIPEYDLGAVSMRVLTKMLAQQEKEEEEKEDFETEIELGYLFTKRTSTKG